MLRDHSGDLTVVQSAKAARRSATAKPRYPRWLGARPPFATRPTVRPLACPGPWQWPRPPTPSTPTPSDRDRASNGHQLATVPWAPSARETWPPPSAGRQRDDVEDPAAYRPATSARETTLLAPTSAHDPHFLGVRLLLPSASPCHERVGTPQALPEDLPGYGSLTILFASR